jgi:hypothetical protein
MILMRLIYKMSQLQQTNYEQNIFYKETIYQL